MQLRSQSIISSYLRTLFAVSCRRAAVVVPIVVLALVLAANCYVTQISIASYLLPWSWTVVMVGRQ